MLISINDRAKLKNESQRNRTAKRTLGLGGSFDVDGDGTSANVEGDISSETDTDGTGDMTRSESIDLSVAAVVTEVLPNGNLMINGSQEVRVNAELRILTIAGIVRPTDIGALEHDPLRPHRRGAGLLWRPRPADRGAAAALRPADPRHRPAVLRIAMATATRQLPAKPGPSIVIQIGLLLVMTAAAVGIGWFSGGYLNGTVPHEQAADAAAAACPGGRSRRQGRRARRAEGKARASMAKPQRTAIRCCSTCRRSPPTSLRRATSGFAWN